MTFIEMVDFLMSFFPILQYLEVGSDFWMNFCPINKLMTKIYIQVYNRNCVWNLNIFAKYFQNDCRFRFLANFSTDLLVMEGSDIMNLAFIQTLFYYFCHDLLFIDEVKTFSYFTDVDCIFKYKGLIFTCLRWLQYWLINLTI